MYSTIYVLSGTKPINGLLGLYDSFNEAFDAMQAYFEKSLNEDGAGKYMYQFDTYLIESRDVGLPADRQNKIWHVEYKADYAAGTCKEIVED